MDNKVTITHEVNRMPRTLTGNLRIFALSEGISYLVLLLIAMPLKYIMDFPIAVKVVGVIHGLLFILYAILVLLVIIRKKWSILWGAWAILLAFIPFGTFYLDKQLKQK